MIRALFTAATGLNAQATVIDNTSNNLANVNTNGFKKGQADFQDLIYVNEKTPGAESFQGQQVPVGLQIGNGSRVSGITKVFSQGATVSTQNPLDLAIEGQGFLQVQLPNGDLRYTRDGALRQSATGNLVTIDGFAIQPALTIPTDAVQVNIASDGTVSITNSTGATSPVGQLTLVRFPNAAGLSAEGRNLFSETASSGSPLTATPGVNGTGLLRQAFLERSNVDAVTELVGLILAQRAYEFNTRAIRTADNMLQSTTDLIR